MIRLFTTPALILAATMALSACATPYAVSRNAPLDTMRPVIEVPMQDWSIQSVTINVPQSLTVSEANTIKPRADIVWREDPLGDRYAQVEALMTRALSPVMRPREAGATPVIVSLDVTRFHALTERARYTIGGEHEIEFILTVTHAETGEILSGPRPVDLTFAAMGGQKALAEQARGITQAVRITQRLQQWALMEFAQARPDDLVSAQITN